MKNLFYYVGANPTADLFLVKQPAHSHEIDDYEILLIRRGDKVDTCPGQWAFPAGFVDSLSQKGEVFQYNKETAADAALRELKEETGLTFDVKKPEDIVKFVAVFEGNKRDPRDNDISWSKSHVFAAVLTTEMQKEYADALSKVGVADSFETREVAWKKLGDVRKMNMAFDHSIIVEHVIEHYLKDRVNELKTSEASINVAEYLTKKFVNPVNTFDNGARKTIKP